MERFIVEEQLDEIRPRRERERMRYISFLSPVCDKM